ncbi:MAG: hypothetical protein M1818_006415 [Claussenomyces sp. TS43310]|nr:MAG: hypothetical protein M1818_006415 [Claussenomyces sp. TS43310]
MTTPPSSLSGGFLPSPRSPASSDASTSNSASGSPLPHPRNHPLRAGSSKEEAARRFVEGRLLHVSRRYTKKFQPLEPGDAVKGYESIKEACKDLSEVIDVLWLSGTPSLQIPYLMNVALSLTTYLSAFPPSPAPTFALLRKLDHAFASLLYGEDVSTGEPLPGLDAGGNSGMSRTDMVRCKSLVQSTRVQIVDVMSKEPEEDGDKETEEDTEMDDANAQGETDWEMNEGDDEYEMDVARVYEKTIIQLNSALGTDTGYEAGNGS